jgi:hypothetical protein
MRLKDAVSSVLDNRAGAFLGAVQRCFEEGAFREPVMDRLAKFINDGVVTIPDGVVVEATPIAQPENVQLVKSNRDDRRRSEDTRHESVPPPRI